MAMTSFYSPEYAKPVFAEKKATSMAQIEYTRFVKSAYVNMTLAPGC